MKKWKTVFPEGDLRHHTTEGLIDLGPDRALILPVSPFHKLLSDL